MVAILTQRRDFYQPKHSSRLNFTPCSLTLAPIHAIRRKNIEGTVAHRRSPSPSYLLLPPPRMHACIERFTLKITPETTTATTLRPCATRRTRPTRTRRPRRRRGPASSSSRRRGGRCPGRGPVPGGAPRRCCRRLGREKRGGGCAAYVMDVMCPHRISRRKVQRGRREDRGRERGRRSKVICEA